MTCRKGQGRAGLGHGREERVDKNGGKNRRKHACADAAARRSACIDESIPREAYRCDADVCTLVPSLHAKQLTIELLSSII